MNIYVTESFTMPGTQLIKTSCFLNWDIYSVFLLFQGAYTNIYKTQAGILNILSLSTRFKMVAKECYTDHSVL
mgnify:CR=1 FL=1